MLTKVSVVYRYSCKEEWCQPHQVYIGYTATTLKHRMASHTESGCIKEHNRDVHNRKTKSSDALENTEILHRSQDRKELMIAEALLIKQHEPRVNNQREGDTRILNVF